LPDRLHDIEEINGPQLRLLGGMDHYMTPFVDVEITLAPMLDGVNIPGQCGAPTHSHDEFL
jgi:hypothetical protein